MRGFRVEAVQNLCVYCMLSKRDGQKLLDGLDAYVCENCSKRFRQYLEEPAVESVKKAPFNSIEVRSLEGYQKCSLFYSYVCSKGHTLAPAHNGLFCEPCSFSLDWAYIWTLNGTWSVDNGYGIGTLADMGQRRAQIERTRQLA
jgi:hypothetical protein